MKSIDKVAEKYMSQHRLYIQHTGEPFWYFSEEAWLLFLVRAVLLTGKELSLESLLSFTEDYEKNIVNGEYQKKLAKMVEESACESLKTHYNCIKLIPADTFFVISAEVTKLLKARLG